jgi:hypothetical protein
MYTFSKHNNIIKKYLNIIFVLSKMTDFIYEIKNSIPDELCDDIINMYELEDNKYGGLVFSGLRKDIKDTTDLIISKNEKRWERVEKILYNTLTNCFAEYMSHMNKSEYTSNNITYNLLESNKAYINNFMIQKYEKCKGKYIYHNDFSVNFEKKAYRVVTFIWYLNNVTEGGETEFWGNYTIKPEKGKLVFFPASWCYPHRGKMPISDDKYIITNWFYIDKT